MRTRTALVGIAAWLLVMGAVSHAAYTVPAVHLPAQTPDIVRDRVARSLASTRDQVGRVLHPFRGEFHGLGFPTGGGSYAIDVSGDGRVILGEDRSIATGRQAFVWSPATGRTPYNMLPSGASGTPFVTSISSDGVYVGGSATVVSKFGNFTRSFNSGVLWSLSGSQSFAGRYNDDIYVASLSGDGSVVVGSESNFGTISCSCFGSYITREVWAYRYTRGGNFEEIDWLTSDDGVRYINSRGIDVSKDGDTVLINGFDSSVGDRAEPFLWNANGELRPLGQATITTQQGPTPVVHTLLTRGEAISANGSTVVGSAQSTIQDYYETGLNGTWPVLWREQSGWIDLGRLKTTAGETFIGGIARHVSGDGSIVVGSASLESLNADSSVSPTNNINAPFLWDEARGMRDLADVLQLDYGLDLSGWTLNEATGISDDGSTIIGNGRNPAGQSEAWRAVLARTTPLGDIDFDGDVDPQDYAQLKLNLGANSADSAVVYADGDLNADGRVDQADAVTLLGLYQGRKRGDFNADGVVNIADYTVWRDHLGQFTGGLADSNGDGWVNHADLASWRSHFGRVLGALLPLSIPEPTAAALLAATSLAFVSQRR